MSANAYFESYKDYFWHWEEGGNVISIRGGSTIAYREFIAGLLEKLADQGLPPFGSLLLAIIATNPNGAEDLKTVSDLFAFTFRNDATDHAPELHALAFLHLLTKVPAAYKKGRGRLLLFQTLFADCQMMMDPSVSKLITGWYKDRNFKNDEQVFSREALIEVFHNDLRVIAFLHGRFPDVASLLRKMADVPQLDAAIEPEKNDDGARPAKDFIQELEEDLTTFHVGSLVKRLWSGLNIPFHNALPSQQPVGGVSDLTNKGEFHRLLVSEFANEDLVFLTRLANNEALYLNREVPPQKSNMERVLLIDVSIKNWGIPKTLAYAVLLAIARHPKTDIPCTAYAVGNSLHPLKFATVHELIESLMIVEPTLHPAKGLEQFFREKDVKRNVEVFFISSTETFRHPSLYKVLSDNAGAIQYQVKVDAKGEIDLFRRQQNSQKHVQHLSLPLHELWARKPPKGKETQGSFHVYPILVPGSKYPKKILAARNDTIFQVTTERCLLRMNPGNSACEMIYENLPFTDESAIGLLEDGGYMLLIFKTSTREVRLINLSTTENKLFHFEKWNAGPNGMFTFFNNRFHFIYTGHGHSYHAFDWDTGKIESVDSVDVESFRSQKERKEEQKELYNKFANTRSVLKNVNRVFINQVDNLVLNIHELRHNEAGAIRLENSGFTEARLEATNRGNGVFAFPGGSTVEIKSFGLMILRNAETGVSVFITLLVDASLGAASTNNDFAGNTYYQHKGFCPDKPLATPEFWKSYLVPFIQNVKNHGAGGKAK